MSAAIPGARHGWFAPIPPDRGYSDDNKIVLTKEGHIEIPSSIPEDAMAHWVGKYLPAYDVDLTEEVGEASSSGDKANAKNIASADKCAKMLEMNAALADAIADMLVDLKLLNNIPHTDKLKGDIDDLIARCATENSLICHSLQTNDLSIDLKAEALVQEWRCMTKPFVASMLSDLVTVVHDSDEEQAMGKRKPKDDAEHTGQ